jgi:hypothetical protein
VLLIEDERGTPLDIALAALPFEERVLERSTPYPFAADALLRTCSAEDLVVLKAFADRPQDWLDIEGVVVRQGRLLERSLVLAELRELLTLKEDLSALTALERVFGKHSQP